MLVGAINAGLGTFIAVTGVSGSGKSSLVNEVLYNTLARRLHRAQTSGAAHDDIEGLEQIDKVINVDQQPIGNTPSSNPATYTGVLDPIRDLFSRLPEASMRGYSKSRFSFNVEGGRCEACGGAGAKYVMNFRARTHPVVFAGTAFACAGVVVMSDAACRATL